MSLRTGWDPMVVVPASEYNYLRSEVERLQARVVELEQELDMGREP